jgi:hypothetical protein
MRFAGQVESGRGRGGGTPYKVTRWLREGVSVLVAGANWERQQLLDSCAPLAPIDVETIFLLAIPLVDLPSTSAGSGRLAVDFSNGDRQALAGAAVYVEGGQPVSVSQTFAATSTARLLDPRRHG